MKNLFFNQRESWLLWLIVGVCASALVLLIANTTQQPSYVIAVNVIIFLLLTFYMAYAKRFTFLQALKISVVIFSLVLAPMLFFTFDDIKLFGNADIIIKFFVLSLLVVSSSVVCSIIVRKRKDYF
jgi:4-hydroxybenzoate polyprenyltransferase